MYCFYKMAKLCSSWFNSSNGLSNGNEGNFLTFNFISLQTIFSELPRLSNVSPDEWISPGMFSCDDNCPLPLRNSDTVLIGCKVASWIIKSTGMCKSVGSKYFNNILYFTWHIKF